MPSNGNGTQAALIQMATQLATIRAKLEAIESDLGDDRKSEIDQSKTILETLRVVREINDTLQPLVADDRSHHSDSAVHIDGVAGEFFELKTGQTTILKRLADIHENKQRRHELLMVVIKWALTTIGSSAVLYKLLELAGILAL